MSVPLPVLVIGGGCGGVSSISALRKLDPDLEIVLVEPKDFCELVWASYRAPFDEGVADRSTPLLAPFCEKNNVKHLRTKVTSLTDGQAELEDGTTVDFSAAIVSVGANIPSWSASGNGLPVEYDGSRVARLQAMKEYGARLVSVTNKKTVVLGGGLVGVELAGDIAGYNKEAKNSVEVTLIHSGDRLMPEFSEGASSMAKKKLESLGVTVLLNERGVEKDGKVLLEKSGKVLEADEIASVIGLRANNQFVQINGSTDKKGFLQTDDHFRLNGAKKVFAYGDCCTTLRNAAYLIMQNGEIVAHNVKILVDGKSTEDMRKMNEGMKIGIVTIGPHDGVAQLPWFHTQYLLPRLKNSTMMIPSSKPQMGID